MLTKTRDSHQFPNWYGIVYDLAGVVLAEQGTGLFEGELVHATRLYKDWYHCAFN